MWVLLPTLNFKTPDKICVFLLDVATHNYTNQPGKISKSCHWELSKVIDGHRPVLVIHRLAELLD
jgi:hypothetical protein